jgi:dethiobiotin synthetase
MTTPIGIIGTDTEIGKTYTCCKIMEYLAPQDYPIASLKPIASGVINTEDGPLNEDVYYLAKANPFYVTRSQINQFSFKLPIAPHIAAQMEQVELTIQTINAKLYPVIAQLSDLKTILIEGVGGLMVPLNNNETYLDLVGSWNCPLILVVGLKLGCLNHALLTLSALHTAGLNVVGWIANQVDPHMQAYAENLEFLINHLSVPLLATITYHGQLEPTSQFKEIFQCN